MFVNDPVRVVKLARAPSHVSHGAEALPAEQDRSRYVDRDGVLTMRLTVAWNPDLGALWRVRFDDRTEEVFAEAELARLDAAGGVVGTEIDEVKEAWGKAPRTGSAPFRRRATTGLGQAILAFIILSIAGLLLVWAGLAQGDLRIAGAGGVLVLVALGAAAVKVS